MHASGRWNTIGQRITYCGPNPSAALLEVLAHLKWKVNLLPLDLQFSEIDLPDSVERERLDMDALPFGWREDESHTQAIGDAWLASRRTAVLEVPSVLSPKTYNLLLNPLHPQASSITIAGPPIVFPLDPRLIALPRGI